MALMRLKYANLPSAMGVEVQSWIQTYLFLLLPVWMAVLPTGLVPDALHLVGQFVLVVLLAALPGLRVMLPWLLVHAALVQEVGSRCSEGDGAQGREDEEGELHD